METLKGNKSNSLKTNKKTGKKKRGKYWLNQTRERGGERQQNFRQVVNIKTGQQITKYDREKERKGAEETANLRL